METILGSSVPATTIESTRLPAFFISSLKSQYLVQFQQDHYKKQSPNSQRSCMLQKAGMLSSKPASGDKAPAKLSPVCTNCRDRHLKCDGGPLCSRCRNEGATCVFKPSRRGMRPNRGASTSDRRPSNPAPMNMQWMPIQSPSQLHPGPLQSAPSADPGARSQYETQGHPALLARPSAHLIDLFYSHFHPTHPFVLPRAHLAERLIRSDFRHLQAAIEYVGSFYDPTVDRGHYQYEAEMILIAQQHPRDLYEVQALLLLAIGLQTDGEPTKAHDVLKRARDLGVAIGINDPAMFSQYSGGHPAQQESWRVTSWTLNRLCQSWPPIRPLIEVPSSQSQKARADSYIQPTTASEYHESTRSTSWKGPSTFQNMTSEEFLAFPETSAQAGSTGQHAELQSGSFHDMGVYDSGSAIQFPEAWGPGGSLGLPEQPPGPRYSGP